MALYGIVDEGSEFGFVAEYCPNGSLYHLFILAHLVFLISIRDAMFESKKELSGVQSISIAYNLAQALNTLHAKRIAHRDIKSANVMVFEKEPCLPFITDYY